MQPSHLYLIFSSESNLLICFKPSHLYLIFSSESSLLICIQYFHLYPTLIICTNLYIYTYAYVNKLTLHLYCNLLGCIQPSHLYPAISSVSNLIICIQINFLSVSNLLICIQPYLHSVILASLNYPV